MSAFFSGYILLFSLCAASKLSRQVGVCWLTRGPGELNHSLSLEPEHLRFCCYQLKDSCLKTPSHTLYLLPLLSQNYRRDSCSYPTSHFSVLGDHAGVISLEIDPCVFIILSSVTLLCSSHSAIGYRTSSSVLHR